MPPRRATERSTLPHHALPLVLACRALGHSETSENPWFGAHARPPSTSEGVCTMSGRPAGCWRAPPSRAAFPHCFPVEAPARPAPLRPPPTNEPWHRPAPAAAASSSGCCAALHAACRHRQRDTHLLQRHPLLGPRSRLRVHRVPATVRGCWWPRRAPLLHNSPLPQDGLLRRLRVALGLAL